MAWVMVETPPTTTRHSPTLHPTPSQAALACPAAFDDLVLGSPSVPFDPEILHPLGDLLLPKDAAGALGLGLGLGQPQPTAAAAAAAAAITAAITAAASHRLGGRGTIRHQPH